MAFSRYTRTSRISAGQQYGTPTNIQALRDAVAAGTISVRVTVLQEGQRLDTIAGRQYGDARYWWVIAACSDVGFAPQVPPGTRLIVPTRLSEIRSLLAVSYTHLRAHET